MNNNKKNNGFKDNEVLESKDNEVLKIALWGLRGAGKSTFLNALFEQFTMSPTITEDRFGCNIVMVPADETFDINNTKAGHELENNLKRRTYGGGTFEIEKLYTVLKFSNTDVIYKKNVMFMDIPGGKVRDNSLEETAKETEKKLSDDSEEIENYIKDSDILYIIVDAIKLLENDILKCANDVGADALNAICNGLFKEQKILDLSDFGNKQELLDDYKGKIGSGTKVVFLLTKIDELEKKINKYQEDGIKEEYEKYKVYLDDKELKNKVKEIFKGTFICLKEKGYNVDIIPIISVGDIKERKNIEEALITPVIRKITEQYIFFTEQYNKKYAEQSKRSGLNNLFHKKKKNDLMVQKNEDDMKRRDFKVLFRIMDNAFKVNKN